MNARSTVSLSVCERPSRATHKNGDIAVCVSIRVISIYTTHIAAGVSFTSWASFATVDIPFLIYGIVHRDALITISHKMWLLINATIAIGVLLYGGLQRGLAVLGNLVSLPVILQSLPEPNPLLLR